MSLLRVDLDIKQGASFDDYFEFSRDGQPTDLTGCAAKMQVRKRVEDEIVVLELSTGNGRLIIDGLAGIVTFNLEPTATQNATWTKGVYDLKITWPDGHIDKCISGYVNHILAVTRAD
ncbi:MAG: hypothetical protein AAF267_25515 [Deinococcota bacterium]